MRKSGIRNGKASSSFHSAALHKCQPCRPTEPMPYPINTPKALQTNPKVEFATASSGAAFEAAKNTTATIEIIPSPIKPDNTVPITTPAAPQTAKQQSMQTHSQQPGGQALARIHQPLLTEQNCS
mmetsp:Transcript_88093/g.174830  ORF Transcript_88093/g.174830 Transcript_88093/m.174830 type:complete len:125 (+) Transcript_88093:589-963(+)